MLFSCDCVDQKSFSRSKVSAYASLSQGSECAWVSPWQGSEYAWSAFHRVTVSEYALIMPEYIWENKVLNMSEFWMCLIQYIVQGHCTSYWTVIEIKTYSEYCQTFKRWRVLQIGQCLSAGAQPEIFQGRGGGFVELGHLDKHFVCQKHKKERPHTEAFRSFFS